MGTGVQVGGEALVMGNGVTTGVAAGKEGRKEWQDLK